MAGLGPVGVVVRIELTPAQLAAVRTDVRAQLVDLVTHMGADDLHDLVREVVYQVVREDMTAATTPTAESAAVGAPTDPEIARLDGANRAPIAP